jgi:hypothetical protein
MEFPWSMRMKTRLAVSMVALVACAQAGLAAEVRTLPPEVYAQMKDSKLLTKLFVSPDFKPAEGFQLGAVDARVESVFAKGLIGYMPYAFGRVAQPEAPNVLTMTLTQLNTKEKLTATRSVWTSKVGLEGRVLAPDGKLLVAFVTWEENGEAGGNLECAKLAADRIAVCLAKELGMPLHKLAQAPKAKAAPAQPAAEPAPVLPAPKGSAPAAPVQEVPAPAAPAAAEAPEPAPTDEGDVKSDLPADFFKATQHH